MNYPFSPVLLANLILTSTACGHGIPIHVEVINDQLVANHPLGDDAFPPPIFGEIGEDGEPFAFVNRPGLGQLVLWQLPGLDIYGMDSASNLSIEVLARPVIDAPSPESRVLWYWNPEVDQVESSPVEFHLLGTSMRTLTLSPSDEAPLTPFLLADPVAGQTGFHNHGLLIYALDNNLIAPAGVYGFFARLISETYAPTDPFLLVFNYNVAYESMIPAGKAIYTAATVLGDYDADFKVDGHDFLIWQRNLGSTIRTLVDGSLNGLVDDDDLAIWKSGYASGANSFTRAATVPEPATVVLSLLSLLLSTSNSRPRDLRVSPSKRPWCNVSPVLAQN